MSRKTLLPSLHFRWFNALLVIFAVLWPTHKARNNETDETRSAARRYVHDLREWRRLDIRLAEQIIEAADRYKIERDIAFGLVAVESGFDSTAISNKGAIGLTQVRVPTAKGYVPDVTVADLRQTERNLDIGLRYLRDMLKRYNGDLRLALVAYNMGPTALDKRISSGRTIPSGYPRMVMAK